LDKLPAFLNWLLYLSDRRDSMSDTDYTDPREFALELDSMRKETLDKVRSGRFGRLTFGDRSVAPGDRPEVAAILRMLMYPERRVADVLANRLTRIDDFDIKERVAEQMLEEINHTQLLRRMLTQWGHDCDAGWTQPLKELVQIFDYIESLETLSEFFSTFLIGEGLFLSTYLDDMQVNDPKAFSPYLEAALADEPRHIKLAADAVIRYATTAELQARTRTSAKYLLQMFLGGYQARVAELHAEIAGLSEGEAKREEDRRAS